MGKPSQDRRRCSRCFLVAGIIGSNTALYIYIYIQDVYTKCISTVISGVVHGLNATVFAYGSTGRYYIYIFLFFIFHHHPLYDLRYFAFMGLSPQKLRIAYLTKLPIHLSSEFCVHVLNQLVFL